MNINKYQQQEEDVLLLEVGERYLTLSIKEEVVEHEFITYNDEFIYELILMCYQDRSPWHFDY